MTKVQLQKEWNMLINETHKRSKIGECLKDRKVSLLGDVLLCAQTLLCKMEVGENTVFNEMIYKKTMSFYCAQMRKYVGPNY